MKSVGKESIEWIIDCRMPGMSIMLINIIIAAISHCLPQIYLCRSLIFLRPENPWATETWFSKIKAVKKWMKISFENAIQSILSGDQDLSQKKKSAYVLILGVNAVLSTRSKGFVYKNWWGRLTVNS